jgi:exopolysaccharide production protein ExoZ
MQAPSPHRNLTTLQSLRGFAALAVCIAHLQGVEAKLGGSLILGKWAEIGFAGVDLFFVISGFVMAWVTRADQGHIAAIPRFYLHRFARIYPLWWCLLPSLQSGWSDPIGFTQASSYNQTCCVHTYCFQIKPCPCMP